VRLIKRARYRLFEVPDQILRILTPDAQSQQAWLHRKPFARDCLAMLDQALHAT
jgi:hypothetical protein